MKLVSSECFRRLTEGETLRILREIRSEEEKKNHCWDAQNRVRGCEREKKKREDNGGGKKRGLANGSRATSSIKD